MYLRDVCPGPDFDKDKDEGYPDNNEEQYHRDPYLTMSAQCLQTVSSTYSDSGYTRLRRHSPPRNIAYRDQIMIRAEHQATSLSEVYILSLASLYHVELKPASAFASQETEAVAHVGKFGLSKAMPICIRLSQRLAIGKLLT